VDDITQGNRFAPPVAHVEDVGPSVNGHSLAGPGKRLVAVLVDAAIGFGILGALAGLTPLNVFRMAPGLSLTLQLAINAAIGITAFFAVHGYLLATEGQTVGKKLLGVRIVRTDGSRASLGRLIGLRFGIGFLVAIVPFVGGLYSLVDSLLIFRASRKCLHDNIADTIVVNA
jgi:uncharacterized RDD family membrane protein YckC